MSAFRFRNQDQLIVILCLGFASAFMQTVGTFLAIRSLPLAVYILVYTVGSWLFGWSSTKGANNLFSRIVGRDQLAKLPKFSGMELECLRSILFFVPLLTTFLAAYYLTPILTPMIPAWLLGFFGVLAGVASGGNETLYLIFAIFGVLIITGLGLYHLRLQKENEQLREALAKAKKRDDSTKTRRAA